MEDGKGKRPANRLKKGLAVAALSLAAVAGAGVLLSQALFRANDRGYMGSEACKTCHAAAWQTWSETRHAKDIKDVKEGAVVHADLNSNFVCSGMTVDFTLGNKHEQQYLTRLEEKNDGFLYLLPCKWDFGKKEIETSVEGLDAWREKSFEDRCMGCHAVDYRPETRTRLELGVGCEKCHGPGAWHRRIFSRDRMFVPSEGDVIQEAMTCGQCHLQGGFAKGSDSIQHPAAFQPRQNLLDQYDFDFSAVEESARAVFAGEKDVDVHQKYVLWRVLEKKDLMWTCTNCHTVHGDDHKRHEEYSENERICLICHVSADRKTAKEWPLRPYSEDCGVCGFSTAD